MHFTKSADLTFGLELELQIVDSKSGRLSPSSLDLWDTLKTRPDAAQFALEATL